MVLNTFDEPIPERTLIARIYRVDELTSVHGPCLSVEFDGIDEAALTQLKLATDYRDLLLLEDYVDPFGLLRLELSKKDFQKEAGIEPQPGSWFAIQLARKPGKLGWPVDHAQLTAQGYTDGSSGYISGIEFIANDDDIPPQPLSASVPRGRGVRQIAINNGAFPIPAIARWKGRRAIWIDDNPTEAIVQDVGQGSFISFHDERGAPVLHFDVGWPVAFNSHTQPTHFPQYLGMAPVILSHWDWDHLHGFHVAPYLRRVPWFAPAQNLGPGASRVAAQLDAANLLYGLIPQSQGPYVLMSRTIGRPCGEVGVCLGRHSNRNQTGLAIAVRLRGGINLLATGDADYNLAVAALNSTAQYDALIVTHHGADFSGSVPSPSSHARKAVVSYGLGNTYQHPHPSMQVRHAGWRIEPTAQSGHLPRGPRIIP